MSPKSFTSFQFQFASLVLLILFAFLAKPNSAGPIQQRQSRLKGPSRLAMEQQQEPIEQIYGSNNQQRLYFPSNSRIATWNDWSTDPVDQILSLKRASLLARLATQSARGFGRK